MVVFFHPLLLRIIFVSEHPPLTIKISSTNTLELVIETHLHKEAIEFLTNVIGKKFIFNEVSYSKNNKPQIHLIETH